MIDQIVIVIYGLFLLVGAFIGFKAGSKVSLIMGLLSSSVVFLGLYLSRQNFKMGFGIIAGVSIVLVLVFIKRYLKTKKVMPAIPLIVLSLIALIVSVRNFI